MGMGSNWKKYLLIAVVVFLIAFRPETAATLAEKGFAGFVKLVDGVSVIAANVGE